MKTLLKIVGAFVMVLVLAVAVFYFGWMSPPSAEAVCDNVARIAKAETGVDYPATSRAQCVEQAQTRPKYGLVPWVKQLKCMKNAETSKELTQCDGRRS